VRLPHTTRVMWYVLVGELSCLLSVVRFVFSLWLACDRLRFTVHVVSLL
jgi:hypothetical protein